MLKKTKIRIRQDEEDDDEVPHFSDPNVEPSSLSTARSSSPSVLISCLKTVPAWRTARHTVDSTNMLEPPDDEHELAKIRLSFYKRLHHASPHQFKDTTMQSSVSRAATTA